MTAQLARAAGEMGAWGLEWGDRPPPVFAGRQKQASEKVNNSADPKFPKKLFKVF